jgi:hypothetical protein
MSILHAVSASTVLAAVGWVYKRRAAKREDRVLGILGARDRRWPWWSAYGVVARMRYEGAYRYARVAFQPRVNDWLSFKRWLRLLPDRLAYFYYRTFAMPSISEADRILRNLWKRNLLICPPGNPGIYQLKN